MRKKTAFWIGLLGITVGYAIPLAIAVLFQAVWILIPMLACFFGSAYFLYRITYKVKPKYPIVPPTGQPDVYYRFRIPRPIYEDVEQYPWLFKKRKQKWTDRTKKVKKKH